MFIVHILKSHPPACCANFLSSKSRLGSLWVLWPNWNNDRFKVTTRHSFHSWVAIFYTWIVRGSWVWWVYPSVSISQFTCSTRYWINCSGQSEIIINFCGSKKKLQPLSLLHHAATLQLLVQLYWEYGFPEREILHQRSCLIYWSVITYL